MDIKIAAAYVRVSTDDQLEYSPDSQIKAVRDYAKREGYIIPDEYVFQDDGISGKSAQKRPSFRLMIATAKQDPAPFSAIFVWKYSRFARNQEEAIMYKNLLRKKGIDVRSISEPSSDSPFASLIERIIEWMDEYYLINLAEEVRRGQKERVSRGEISTSAPFGYAVKDKTFVPDNNADVVRYVFSKYAEGSGFREIARDLNEKGIKTKQGNSPENRWVRYMLGNPVYIGKLRWSNNGILNYTRVGQTPDGAILVDGRHEPIIDMDTWNAVQEKLCGRDLDKYRGKNDRGEIMLRGIVRCSACGATLIRTHDRFMQCSKYTKGACQVSHGILISRANEAVISALETCVRDKTYTFTPPETKKEPVKHDFTSIIKSEESKLARAKQAMLNGALEIEEYKEIKNDIESNISSLRAAKEKEQDANPKKDYALQNEKTVSVLNILKSPDVDEKEKNRALRSIIDKIVYHKVEQQFDIYFSP